MKIRKQSGSNTVAVATNLKERLAELQKLAPKDYRVEVVRDQSVFIETSIDMVKEHLVVGSILAAIVVFFFLGNTRATIIAAISIPTSIIAAFAIVDYMGFTLNSITLLALTLSVGIVIDDAIVVMENILRYIEEEGYSPREAAVAATQEIGLAVMAITISLVAVFLPIAMLGGISGRFLKAFGITMSGTIMVSMLVSFTLTPMLSARWFKKPSKDDKSHAGKSASRFQVVYGVIERAYMAALGFSLRHRWIVVVAVIICMAAVVPLGKMVNKNFTPDEDSSEFEVTVQAKEGTSLEATRVLITRIARDIRQLNGVRYTISSIADTDERIPYKGTIYVRLVDIAARQFGQLEMMQYIREHSLPKYVTNDNLRIRVSPVSAFSGGGMSNANISYLVGGPDIQKLEKAANTIMADLRKVPGVVDIDSTLSLGKPQFGIIVDRAKAGELGVSISDISTTLQLLVAGRKVSDFNDKGEQYEVHVRSIADVRNQRNALAMITVPSSKYGVVPLGDIIHFEKGEGPAQINRLARTRQVTINANTAPNTSEQTVIDAINNATTTLDLGPEYRTGLLGRSKEMGKAFRSFVFAFVLAFLFVYMCIAAQFESLLHPITILLCLPLTLPFALASLLIFNQSLNLFSLLGIMVLFAVVKKNSILQIDHANQLRAKGMPKLEAIMNANRDRLRPILMTTVAFVAGMIPTFLSNAAGSETNKAISGVIIGGQTFSLLLTLLATPVAYSLFDDLAVLFAKWFRFGESVSTGQLSAQQRRDPAHLHGQSGEIIHGNLPSEAGVIAASHS
jgi:HAE1 family hydrophobic/amphiphilic exporter-1